MVSFTGIIKQFGSQGEKTGWHYIEIPNEIAEQIKPNNKKSFRVKGKIDDHKISGIALLPMGGGNFIIALNAGLRKSIHKRKGAMIKLMLQEDKKGYELNADFKACLEDDADASKYFNSLPLSHRNYFSKWIDSAKTEQTKTKRIAAALNALSKNYGYGEMLREMKKDRYT